MARITGPLSEHDAADRSRGFHGVVSDLFYVNHSVNDIVVLMEPHENGVAQRYIEERRVSKMVERSFNKIRDEFEAKRAQHARLFDRASPPGAAAVPPITDNVQAPGATNPTAEDDDASGKLNREALNERKLRLAEMNAGYFVLRNFHGRCVVGEFVPNQVGTGAVLSVRKREEFNAAFANKYVPGLNTKGDMVPKALGEFWLKHPKRREYEGIELVPGEPQILPNGKLNLWRGFGVQPEQGEWPRLRDHIYDVVTNGDEKMAIYTLRWIAWKLQHPGECAEVALVLKGKKGSGKGVLLRIIVRIFGGHGLQINNPKQLTGSFNAHMRQCLFLFADEAHWAGDKQGAGILQGLITEPTIMLEPKGFDAAPVPNMLAIALAAEADWVVPAGANERRYAVTECASTYVRGHCSDKAREAYFTALNDEIDKGGLKGMMFDLMNWDVKGWHPRQIHETAALRHQQELSLSDLDQWYFGLLEDGQLPERRATWFGSNVATAKTLTLPNNEAMSYALIADAKMRTPRLRDLSEHKLGAFLKKKGCTKRKHKLATETRSLK